MLSKDPKPANATSVYNVITLHCRERCRDGVEDGGSGRTMGDSGGRGPSLRTDQAQPVSRHRLIHLGAPRPTLTHVTTAGGRSPGSQVIAFDRPSQSLPASVVMSGRRLAAYSCGGSRSIVRLAPNALRSLLIPEGNHRLRCVRSANCRQLRSRAGLAKGKSVLQFPRFIRTEPIYRHRDGCGLTGQLSPVHMKTCSCVG